MFRYLVIFAWVAVFVLLLLRLKARLTSGNFPLVKNVSSVLENTPVSGEETGAMEDFVLSFLKDWDFDRFYFSVDPDLKRQIPAEGLKTLFEGVSEGLGPLDTVYDTRESTAAAGESTLLLDGGFTKARASIEVGLRKNGNSYRIIRFSVQSAVIEKINQAAEEAYQQGRLNPTVFFQRVHNG